MASIFSSSCPQEKARQYFGTQSNSGASSCLSSGAAWLNRPGGFESMKEALKRISSPFDSVCFSGGGAHHKGRSLVENPKSQPFSGNADNRPFSRTRQPACRDFLARVGHIDRRSESFRAADNPAVRVFLTLFRRGFAPHSGSNQSHNPNESVSVGERDFGRQRGGWGVKEHTPSVSLSGLRGARAPQLLTQSVAGARHIAGESPLPLSQGNRKPHGRAFRNRGVQVEQTQRSSNWRWSEIRDISKALRTIAVGNATVGLGYRRRPHCIAWPTSPIAVVIRS
jgi:hypothetical protein